MRGPAVDLMNFASLASGVGEYYFLSPEGIIFIKGGIPLIIRRWALRNAAKAISNIGYTELQALVRADSKVMNAFFKSKGSVVPSKEALLNYKELATRMLNGTGGAYQRVTEAAAKLHTERIEMINNALKSLK